MVIFRATVETQTGSKGIRRQIEQTEVCKSSEQASVTRNVLVNPGDKLVIVATRTAGRSKIIHSTSARGSNEIRIPHFSCGLAKFCCRDLVVEVGLTSTGALVHCVRVVKLDALR